MAQTIEQQEDMDARVGISYIASAKRGRIRGYFDSLLDHFITVMFIVMFLIIVINVFSRALPFVIYWAEIASIMANLYVTFIGAALLIQKGEHIRVNYFDERLQNKGLFNTYAFAANIIILLVSVVFMLGAYGELQTVWHEYLSAWPVVRTSVFWMPPFAGMVLLIIYVLINLYAIIQDSIKKRAS